MQNQTSTKSSFVKKNSLFAISLAVGFLAFLIYLPTLDYEFVNWDDPQYVYNNKNIQTLDSSSVEWMVTEFYAANWHPLTWLAHAIDFKIWGKEPIGHHLSNIIHHGINSSLVVILVFYLTAFQGSSYNPRRLNFSTGYLGTERLIIIALSGLLFALHPLHVESVAWVTERKELLCSSFFLLSIILYVRYTIVPPGKKKGLIFGLSLLSSMLALMSKPMAVTIPAVLLLLDFYPLNRFNPKYAFTVERKILLEKVPFFLLSLSSIILTILAQKSWGAMSLLDARPLDLRFLVAIKAICFYLLKMIVPTNLSPLYPYPNDISLLDLQIITSIICILAIASACIILWKKHKSLPSAFAYYLITLLPVLGIIQVGGQATADRYTYLPSIGPFLLIGLGVSRLMGNFRIEKEKSKGIRYLISVLVVIFLTFYSTLTLKQMEYWKDSVSLWNRVISIYPDQSWVAYYNRASAFLDSKNYEKAIKDFSKVIELNPFYAYTHYSRGKSYLEVGDYYAAIRDFSRAIQLDNNNPTFYLYRGRAYGKLGEHNKSFRDSAIAIRLKARQDKGITSGPKN